MIIYIVYYDKGYHILEENKENFKRVPSTKSIARYKKNVGFYGYLYNMESVFISREVAQKYIQKEYIKENERIYFE